jgi:uncharacterized protein (DUF433 family)
MHLKEALHRYISTSPEILGGTPVFKNTRVPIKILFDYLQGGENIKEFLSNYPTVKPSHVDDILELLSKYTIDIETDNETFA